MISYFLAIWKCKSLINIKLQIRLIITIKIWELKSLIYSLLLLKNRNNIYIYIFFYFYFFFFSFLTNIALSLVGLEESFQIVGPNSLGMAGPSPHLIRKLSINLFSEMVRVPIHILIGILAQLKLFHYSFSSTAKNSSKLPCSTASCFPFLEPLHSETKISPFNNPSLY